MILIIEIGMTFLGLMAILKQKWSVGKNRYVIGSRALFLGGLSFITIPVVFLLTIFLQSRKQISADWQINHSILTLHYDKSDLTTFLIELIIVLVWASIIFGISGGFNWVDRGVIIEEQPETILANYNLKSKIR